MVEFFSGISMVAQTGRMLGLKAAALDLDFDHVTNRPGAMDLRTPAGFVLHGQSRMFAPLCPNCGSARYHLINQS